MAPVTEEQRRNLEAVRSKEYQAALAAQIDYDSTSQGQKKLDEALQACRDTHEARGLIARKVAGLESRESRKEQVVFMPPVVRRGQPGFKEYNALADARERLARDLGRAAAETNAWTKPSPATVQQVADQYDAVAQAEVAHKIKPSGWRHPRILAASTDRAPWLGSKFTRDLTVRDVIILINLGLDATWREGKLFAQGNPDAAFRWGYTASQTPDGQGWVFAQAPDIPAWHKAQTAGK